MGLAFAAAPAAAAPPANGSWNVTGTESYSNQVFVMGNITDIDGNATDYGNVTVTATGDLTFNNVTLFLPFASTFDIQGRLVIRNSTIDGSYWKLWLRGTVELTDNHFVNNSNSGTLIETTAQVIERNNWNCADYGGALHIKRTIDFRNNTLDGGCAISVELATITVNKDITYSNLTIRNTGGATGITVADSFHTGRVRFDYDHLTINGTGGGWGIQIGATASTTSYQIHDSAISNTGSAAIRCDSFDGGMAIFNVTFTDVLRAARMDGLPGGTVVATIDNITSSGTTDSILANDMTWIIRNSTIGGASPQFDAGANGHIKIYDSADTAFLSNFPAAGGSIEHFIRLEMAVPTWQNGVAITDDLVTLVDSLGTSTVIVNASTWSPREIVWWGMYPNNVKADNRDLRPKIFDGNRAFNCTPALFLVSPGMAMQPVTCNDDAPPQLTFQVPTFPHIQNSSLLSGLARVDEAGSGLNTVEYSLDGVSFGPVIFAPGDTRNFTFARPAMPDGTYTLTLRAMDRTGNPRVITGGPYTIDTVSPLMTFDPPPPLVAAAASYTFTGDTEPNTSVFVARAGGFSNSTMSGPNGRFAIGVLLEEGLNTYTLTARDAAGNGYSLSAALLVDMRPPTIVVLLDGAPVTVAREALPSVHVEGTTETAAEVRVNGQAAGRTGADFAFDLPLARGRTNITVTATDAAGNVATWYGVAYYDDALPGLTLEVNGDPLAGRTTVATHSGSVSIAGAATDADSGIASVIVGGQPVSLDGANGFSTVVSVTEGENTVVITASDVVGNTATISFVIIRDSTPPSLAVSIEADTSPVVFADGANMTAGATVKLVLVASEAGTATFGGAPHALVQGTNEFVLTLAEGRNALTVSFSDLAGNPSVPASFVIERKSTAPALSVTSPLPNAQVDAAAVEIVGTTDPQATVRVNGTLVPVSLTGEFHAHVALALGSNTVRVEVTDALGNTNSTTTTITRTAGSGNTNPTPASGGLGVEAFALLIVGLAAGVGAGMAMGRRGRANAAAPPPADEPAPEAGEEPSSEAPQQWAPQEPAARSQRGPAPPAQKGPRGPQPPR